MKKEYRFMKSLKRAGFCWFFKEDAYLFEENWECSMNPRYDHLHIFEKNDPGGEIYEVYLRRSEARALYNYLHKFFRKEEE